ncbi:hypothetical protein Tco_0789151 [Tanacetum coccineum]
MVVMIYQKSYSFQLTMIHVLKVETGSQSTMDLTLSGCQRTDLPKSEWLLGRGSSNPFIFKIIQQGQVEWLNDDLLLLNVNCKSILVTPGRVIVITGRYSHYYW